MKLLIIMMISFIQFKVVASENCYDKLSKSEVSKAKLIAHNELVHLYERDLHATEEYNNTFFGDIFTRDETLELQRSNYKLLKSQAEIYESLYRSSLSIYRTCLTLNGTSISLEEAEKHLSMNTVYELVEEFLNN